MSGKSPIQWTDETCLARRHESQVHAIKHLLGDDVSCGLRPLKEVAFTLGAIAGHTGRNDVMRNRPAAPADGDDMVPSRRRVATVSTATGEVFKDNLRTFRWHRSHTALASMGMLPALHSDALLRGIAQPLSGAAMRSALALKYLVGSKPRFATATPCQALQTLGATLRKAGAAPLARLLTTSDARSMESIGTGAINAEVSARAPVFAAGTPLLSGADVALIALPRHAVPLRPGPSN